jgi:hypothetical protein
MRSQPAQRLFLLKSTDGLTNTTHKSHKSHKSHLCDLRARARARKLCGRYRRGRFNQNAQGKIKPQGPNRAQFEHEDEHVHEDDFEDISPRDFSFPDGARSVDSPPEN